MKRVVRNGFDNIARDNAGKGFLSLLLPIFLFLVMAVFARTSYGDDIWAGKQEATAAVMDSSGCMIVTGYQDTNGDEYLTVKFNDAGTNVWSTPYNKGVGSDRATAIALDSAKNVIVTGYVWNTNKNDIYTAKYSGTTGALIWGQTYSAGSGVNSRGAAIAVDINDNVIVGGSANTPDDFVLLKYDANGNNLKVATYNSTANSVDILNSIAVRNNTIVVTGQSAHGNGSDFDVFTKLYTYNKDDSSSSILAKTYNSVPLEWRHPSTGTSAGKKVLIDKDGNVIITARVTSGYGSDIYTAKYNGANGTVIWDKTYQYPLSNSISEPSGMTLDGDNNVYVTGMANPPNTSVFTARYNSDNSSPGAWTALFDTGPGTNNAGSDIIYDSNDNAVYVMGDSLKSDGVNRNFLAIKYPALSAGNIGVDLWHGEFDGGGYDKAVGIGLGTVASGVQTLMIGGTSQKADTGYDYSVTAFAVINKPSGLSTEYISDTSVGLHWTNNAGPGIGFGIERKQGENGSWTALNAANCSGSSCSYTDNADANPTNPVSADKTYYYRVNATSAPIVSNWSNEAIAITQSIEAATATPWYTFASANNQNDLAVGIAVGPGPDNNPVVTGNSTATATGEDYLTVKLDHSTAGVIWQDRYDGGDQQSDFVTGIVVDRNNATTVTGHSGLHPSCGFYTRHRECAEGACAITWEGSYIAPGCVHDSASPVAIAVDSSNNVAVLGYGKNSAGKNDIYLLKYPAAQNLDPDTGNQRPIWSKTTPISTNFNDNGSDIPSSSVAFDNNGNVIITGFQFNNTNKDIFTAKYDGATGDEIWSDTYNGTGNGDDKGLSLAVDLAGNVYVTGTTDIGSGKTVIVTIKYDGNRATNPADQRKWVNEYENGNPNADDEGGAIVYDPIDDTVTVGGTRLTGSGNHDLIAIRYDSDGNPKWPYIYLNSGDEELNSMAMDKSGNVVLAGTTTSGSITKAISLKIGYNGNPLNVTTTAAANNDDVATAVAFNSLGEAFVAGYTRNSIPTAESGNYDYLVYKMAGPAPVLQASYPLTLTPYYSRVILNWADNSPGRTGYEIQRKAGQCDSANAWIPLPNVTSAPFDKTMDNGLAPGDYCYQVRAISYPRWVQQHVLITKAPAPDSVTATTINTTRVDLSWRNNVGNDENGSAGETGFDVYRCNGMANCNAGNYNNKITCTVQTPLPKFNETGSCSDTGVAQNEHYGYRIKAVNTTYSWVSELSLDTTCVQPTLCSVADTPAKQAPPVLAEPVPINITEAKIPLVWSDTNSDRTGYWIKRCTSAGCIPSVITDTVAATATTYSDTNALLPGMTYGYTVCAFKTATHSWDSCSTTVQYATTKTPEELIPNINLQVAPVAGSTTDMKLTWSDPYSSETNYIINRCTGSGCATTFVNDPGFTPVTLPANSTTWTDSSVCSGLAGGTSYYYKVTAVNNALSLGSSDVISTPGTWQYRKKLTFDTFNANFLARVVVPFVPNHMKTGYEDLRFYDETAQKELPYYIESTTTGPPASATITFKTGNFDNIYVYYGNNSARSASSSTTVFGAGLMGYWPFSSASGGGTSDQSGYNYGLNLWSGDSMINGVVGRYGAALNLNGGNFAFLNAPHAPTGSVATAEAWIYPTEYPASVSGIVSWGARGSKDSLSLNLQPNGLPALSTWNNDIATAAGSVPVGLNVWSHIAVVLNGANVTFYLNGVPLQSSPLTLPNGAPTIVSQNLAVGVTSYSSNFFKGKIDEVRLFNSALGPEEIAARYAAAIPTVLVGGENDPNPPGPFSNTWSVTSSAAYSTTPTPSAPTLASVTEYAENQINLNFSYAGNANHPADASKLQILRCNGSPTCTPTSVYVDNLPPGTTSYNDTESGSGLTKETDYRYMIRAFKNNSICQWNSAPDSVIGGARTSVLAPTPVSAVPSIGTNCEDIRVTDNDGTTPLKYWPQRYTCGTTSTVVWPKIPTITAGTSTQKLYLYYGNKSTAVSMEDGKNTMEFFDDFSGSSIDTTTNWDISLGSTGDYSAQPQDSLLRGLNTNGRLVSKTFTLLPDRLLTMRAKTTTVAQSGHMIGGIYNGSGDNLGFELTPTNYGYSLNDQYTSVVSSTPPNYNLGYDFYAYSTTPTQTLIRASSFEPGGSGFLINPTTLTYNLTGKKIALGARLFNNSASGQTYQADWDFVFVRKLAPNALSVATNAKEYGSWNIGGDTFNVRIPMTITNAVANGDLHGYQAKLPLLDTTSLNADRITLTWTNNTSTEIGFTIQRCKAVAFGGTCSDFGAHDTNISANPPVNATMTYIDTLVDPQATYCYRIKANLSGGDYSGYAAFPAPCASTSASLPQPPSNLTYITPGGTQVVLTWNDNSSLTTSGGNEDGFQIDRCTGDGCATTFLSDGTSHGFPAQVGPSSAATASWTDTTVCANNHYYYRVSSLKPWVNGWPSSYAQNNVSLGSAGKPSSVTATRVSEIQIDLTWTYSSPDATAIQIWRCTGDESVCTYADPANSSGHYTRITELANGTLKYSDIGLAPKTTYSYQVVPVGANGTCSWTAPSGYTLNQKATTALSNPDGLTASQASSTGINLNWTNNTASANGFTIQRCTNSGSGLCTNFVDIKDVAATVPVFYPINNYYYDNVSDYNTFPDSSANRLNLTFNKYGVLYSDDGGYRLNNNPWNSNTIGSGATNYLDSDYHGIEFDIKVNAYGWGNIFDYSQNSYAYPSPRLASTDVGKIQWSYTDDVTNAITNIMLGKDTNASAFDIGAWFHVRGVKSGGVFNAYVNGQQVIFNQPVPAKKKSGSSNFKLGTITPYTTDPFVTLKNLKIESNKQLQIPVADDTVCQGETYTYRVKAYNEGSFFTDGSYSVPGVWTTKAAVIIPNYRPNFTTRVNVIKAGHASMKDDFSDIRFWDETGTPVSLQYWIESYISGVSAVVWVKTINNPVNNIKMYFGNSSVASDSNPKDMFDFYDDFNGSTLDSSKWGVSSGGSATVSGGRLNVTSGSVYSLTTIGDLATPVGKVFEMKNNWTNTPSGVGGLSVCNSWDTYGGNGSPTGTTYAHADIRLGGGLQFVAGDGSGGGAGTGWTLSTAFLNPNTGMPANSDANITGTDRIGGVEYQDATHLNVYSKDPATYTLQYLPAVTNFPGGVWNPSGPAAPYIFLGHVWGHNAAATAIYPMSVDWVRVRPYASPEPVGTLDSAETYLISPTVWTKKASVDIPNYQPNAPVRLVVNHSSNMKVDFSDIRFYDETAQSELPYWIESDTSGSPASAIVWIKAGGSASNNIVMYYGNSSASTISNSDARVAVFGSGLVGYWPFEETAQFPASTADLSGNNLSGNLNGSFSGPNGIVSGKIGNGLSLNGTSNYISVPITANSLVNTNGSITVEAWAKYSGATPSSTAMRIVNKFDAGGLQKNLYALHTNAAGTLMFSVGNATTTLSTSGSPQINDNNWHHYAGRYDAATGTVSIIIDGVHNSAYDTTATPVAIGMDTDPVTIGATNFDDPTYHRRYFSGMIDEVRIYNRALNDAEIASHKAVSSGTIGSETSISVPTLSSPNWQKWRVPITNFQPNFQTRVILPASIVNGRTAAQINDLSYYDEVAGVNLPYWVESVLANGTAVVWFKTGANGTISLFSGSVLSAVKPNAANVFEFFDGFTGTALNSRWTATDAIPSDGYSLDNSNDGVLTVTKGSVYCNVPIAASVKDRIFEMKSQWSSFAGGNPSGIRVADATSCAAGNANFNSLADIRIVNTSNNTTSLQSYAGDGSDNSFNIANPVNVPANSATHVAINTGMITGVSFAGFGSISAFNKSADYQTIVDTTTMNRSWSQDRPAYVYLGYPRGANPGDEQMNISPVLIDWVRVRKYASPEPVAVVENQVLSPAPTWVSGYSNTVIAPKVGNILANSSFESGLWAALDLGDWGASDNTTSYSGNKSLRVDPGSYAKGTMKQVNVIPGARYKLSGYIKTAGLDGAKFAICDLSSNPADSIYTNAINSDWTYREATITIPSGITSVNVRCYNKWNWGAGTSWFDDVQLTGPVVSDPDFEKNDSSSTPWNTAVGTMANAGFDSSTAYSGGQSLMLDATTAHVTLGRKQLVSVIPGMHYKLSGYIKTKNWTAGMAQCDVYSNANTNIIDSPGISLSTSSDWTYKEETVIIPSNYSSVYVRCFANANATGNPTGYAWFDMVQLVPDESHVADSGFEANSVGTLWTAGGAASAVIDTTASVTGTKSLKISSSLGTNTMDYITQPLAQLSPGVAYTLSGNIKANLTNGYAFCRLATNDALLYNPGSVSPEYDVVSDSKMIIWTKNDNTTPANSNTTGINGQIPLGVAPGDDKNNVLGTSVILDNGIYKMWYAANDGTSWRINYATSPDGLTWTKVDNSTPGVIDNPPVSGGTISTNGSIPLGSNGTGDSLHTYPTTVIKDNYETNPSYRYKMWYSGAYNSSIWTIFYATSPDGLKWTKQNNAKLSVYQDAGFTPNDNSGQVLLGSPSAGKGDSARMFGPMVIQEGKNSFKMWYTGVDDSASPANRIFYATSLDGINWTKYNNTKPSGTRDALVTPNDSTGQIPLGSAGKGDSSGVLSGGVYRDPQTSAYKMWYSGYDGAKWRVFYATSTDGLNWTKQNNNAQSPSDTAGTWGRIPIGFTAANGDSTSTYVPGVMFDGSMYRMWYGASPASGVWRLYNAFWQPSNISTANDNLWHSFNLPITLKASTDGANLAILCGIDRDDTGIAGTDTVWFDDIKLVRNPVALTATSVSEAQINLVISDQTPDPTGYTLERCIGANCDFTTLDAGFPVMLGRVTTYSDAGLRPVGTTYKYRVKSFRTALNSCNGGWTGEYSNIAQATLAVAAPVNLTATPANTTRIDLAWTDQSVTDKGVRIDRCTASAGRNSCTDSFTTVGYSSAGATTWSDTSACNASYYGYRISPFSQGLSNISNSNTEGKWTRKAPVVISDFAANVQVPLLIPKDNVAQMKQPDLADLRFYDETSKVELPHWFDKKWPDGSATVWIKTGNKNNIWMYYGNDAASSGSSGAKTFEYFDDFNYSGISDPAFASRWSVSSSYGTDHGFSLTGGQLKGTKPQGKVTSLATFSPGVILDVKSRTNSTLPNSGGCGVDCSAFTNAGFFRDFNSAENIGILTHFQNFYDWYNKTTNGIANVISSWPAPVAGKNYIYSVASIDAGNASFSLYDADNPDLKNQPTQIANAVNISGINSPSAKSISLGERYDNWWDPGITYSAEWDWVRVRRYVSPMPTFSSIGTEIQSGGFSFDYTWPPTGQESYSVTVFPIQTPNWVKPGALTATPRNANPGIIDLGWQLPGNLVLPPGNPAADQTGFKVGYCQVTAGTSCTPAVYPNGASDGTAIAPGSAASTVVTGLTASTKYCFGIKATKSSPGSCGASNGWDTDPAANYACVETVTAPPQGPGYTRGASTPMIAAPLNCFKVRLDWSDQATDEDGYEIQVMGRDGRWFTTDWIGPIAGSSTNTSYIDTIGLEPFKSYQYRLRTFHGNANGQSNSYSGFATSNSVTMPACVPVDNCCVESGGQGGYTGRVHPE